MFCLYIQSSLNKFSNQHPKLYSHFHLKISNYCIAGLNVTSLREEIFKFIICNQYIKLHLFRPRVDEMHKHVEFSSRPNGWAFLADIISKYPKREKMMNIIKLMNENKSFNLGSINRIVNSNSFNITNEDRNKVIGEIYKIRNGEQDKMKNKEGDNSDMHKRVQNMKKDL